MTTSKLTSKGQTTIPQAVRDALRVGPGDELAYAIEVGRVILTKASTRGLEDPFATFSEWASDNDTRAYRIAPDRLKNFEAATRRQRAREKDLKLESSTKDRGWKRADLYDRDRNR